MKFKTVTIYTTNDEKHTHRNVEGHASELPVLVFETAGGVFHSYPLANVVRAICEPA